MPQGTISVKLLRHDPDKDAMPSYRTYEVPIEEKTTVLQVLNSIYEDLDRTLAFRRYCCGYKFCNSCRMTINNKSALACHTFVDPEDEITVGPSSDYPVIRDLVVDFGKAISSR
jgi:fumarate reductase iron-sulfur subunit